jgi:hypothetical protein
VRRGIAGEEVEQPVAERCRRGEQLITDGAFMRLYTKWFKHPPSPKLLEFRPLLAKVLPSPSPSG